MQLKIEDLTLKYGDKTVIDNFSMAVDLNGIIAVTGASGCGKTTLARAICGLEKYEKGTISGVEPSEIGFLFQENRLFPWRTALEHITDLMPKERRSEAPKFLELCELSGEEKSFPAELSGGMARRLALARTLAYGGKLYILDESFAAVDDDCAQRILRRIRALGIATLIITHRQAVISEADKCLEFSGIPLKLNTLL